MPEKFPPPHGKEAAKSVDKTIPLFDHEQFLNSPELRQKIIDHLEKTGQIPTDTGTEKRQK